MYVGSDCNPIHNIGLLDYAYLALNVYRSPKDDKLLGNRPIVEHSIFGFKQKINIDGWHQFDFPYIISIPEHTFYAEFYGKVYRGKIHHLMISFRGTFTKKDIDIDIKAWWKTILPGGHHYADNIPAYWDDAHSFIMHCSDVIRELDAANLFADYCNFHVTGHSLGGALANLTAAYNVLTTPTHIKTHFPVMPDVISFNAPGIGTIPHVDKDDYNQHMVISMRAKYDTVSSLGDPYGFVINNFVEAGSTTAKLAFDLQDHLDHKTYLEYILDQGSIPDTATSLIGELALGLSGCLDQHKMGHLFELIANDPSSITFDFEFLRYWAIKHCHYNHDLKGECLYKESMAVAA